MEGEKNKITCLKYNGTDKLLEKYLSNYYIQDIISVDNNLYIAGYKNTKFIGPGWEKSLFFMKVSEIEKNKWEKKWEKIFFEKTTALVETCITKDKEAIYITGYTIKSNGESFIAKFSENGEVRWKKELKSHRVNSITKGIHDDIFITGYTYVGNVSNSFIANYSQDGDKIREEKLIPEFKDIRGITIEDEYIYIIGYNYKNEAAIAKYPQLIYNETKPKWIKYIGRYKGYYKQGITLAGNYIYVINDKYIYKYDFSGIEIKKLTSNVEIKTIQYYKK